MLQDSSITLAHGQTNIALQQCLDPQVEAVCQSHALCSLYSAQAQTATKLQSHFKPACTQTSKAACSLDVTQQAYLSAGRLLWWELLHESH